MSTQSPTQSSLSGFTISSCQQVLHLPVHQTPDCPVVYGLAHHFQISPTEVAMIINRRRTSAAMVDFEDGFDVLVFDDLSGISAQRAAAGIHDSPALHPRSGKPLTMVQHNIQGGFIPLGAKLPDGRPHPHAGTGFGLGMVNGYPADHIVANAHVAADLHSYLMLVQLAYDGTNFRITSAQPMSWPQLLPGWLVFNRGLGPAIADGADLLFGLVAGRDDEPARAHAARLQASGRKPFASAHELVNECYGSGLSRWRFGQGGWRPVDFVPVTGRGPDMSFEPSVIRERDGSLLFCVRGKGSNAPPGQMDEGLENTYEHFRVYRSLDGGASWRSHLHLPQMRTATPVTINQTGDGRPFIAGTPYLPLQTDSTGRLIPTIFQRGKLCLWELNSDRSGVLEPYCLMEAGARLGPPRPIAVRGDNRWYLDHPISGVYRLRDGQCHTLLTFRVSDSAVNVGGAAPAPQAGVWLAQIQCPGPVSSPWRF